MPHTPFAYLQAVTLTQVRSYKMPKYTKQEANPEIGQSEAIIREDDNGQVWWIPCDAANSDYQRYLRWLENPDAEENGTIS